MKYTYEQFFGEGQSRDIIGGPLDRPQWYALKCAPLKERALVEALKRRGIHSCYPTVERQHRIRGKVHKRHYPVVSQIVYAKFAEGAPQWDVLKARRLITGVFSYGDRPIILSGDIIAAVMGLPTEAERLEEARRELLRVREGDRATIAAGALTGHLIDVTRVAGGRIWWETLTGIKGSSEASAVERMMKGSE